MGDASDARLQKPHLSPTCPTLLPLSLLMRREVSGGRVPAAANIHYKRGGSPVLPSMPECDDGHELETLMSMDRQESAHLPEEASEDQRLMPSAPGEEEDLPPSETKVKMIDEDKLFFPFSFFFVYNIGISCNYIKIVNMLHCCSYRLPGMAQ